jgi:hypothetical protein
MVTSKQTKLSDDQLRDAFVDTALAEAERAFGKSKCYVAAEHEAHQLVMEIPPLSLRWLIESNGWPLSRFTQSGGPFGTHKSCFCFQLEAWYLEAGGIASHLDTENKTSSSLMQSIIPRKYFDKNCPEHRRLQFRNALSINEWQSMLIQQHHVLKELVEKAGRKPHFPSLWCVDSLRGSHSEEAIEHIEKEHEAQGRGFSDAPILISNFLGTFPNQLLGWPITLHVSHHEKPALGTHGMSRAGGKAPDFYASVDIQFRRGGSSALSQGEKIGEQAKSPTATRGRNITLNTRKSSLGPDMGKKMVVPFVWKFEADPVTGEEHQVSWWDWNSTTAMLLLEYRGSIKHIMDIDSRRKQNVGETVWSKALGVTDKDPLTASEFGALVQGHQLRPAIEDALRIQRHPLLTPETDL